MSEAYLGEIRAFGFNFAPYGWMFCNGQLLPINQYTALFSILGTTYGGNGVSNFALPNLQGQVPMHWGTGPTTTVIGEVQGTVNVTLQQQQMPQHQHTISSAGAGAPVERSAIPTTTSFLSDTKGGDGLSKSPGDDQRAVFAEGDFADRRHPAARQHVALSGAQFLHLLQRHLPVAKLSGRFS